MPDAPEAKRRAKLGAYGFGATLADSRCDSLSGGEKARLLFALASFHAPHILVLDEPTNHLDVDSREALIMAINDYEGAVILISHDRHIIETCVDHLWLVNDGTVKPFDGDMDDYTRLVLEKSREGRRSERMASLKAAAPQPAAGPRPSAAATQKTLLKLDQKMDEIRDKIAILDRALSDASLYSEEPKKAADFTRLRARLSSELEDLETQWLEAHDA
jgi:ATP-binding cassette subfamily F protein 3